jgi:acyl carrier protein
MPAAHTVVRRKAMRFPKTRHDSSGVNMGHLEAVKDILASVLSLGERRKMLTADTALLGSLPELDSMAVMNLIAALEEHFGIVVNDDEISAEVFLTVGSLASFVDQKTGA